MRSQLKVLNWNIGGAKFLELRSKAAEDFDGEKEQSREDFRDELNRVLGKLVDDHEPAIVTLQEIVRYDLTGSAKKAESIVEAPEGYTLIPVWLIDTDHHSHQGKWNKVRTKGGWPESAFFAQGNGTLVKNSIERFHIFRLPRLDDLGRFLSPPSEVVKLESGIYFGDRDSEPRAALVTHLVLGELGVRRNGELVRQSLERPLDVFVVNLHLTTLMLEREGVSHIDEAAARRRVRQLEIVLYGIVSRYNKWRKDGYQIRGRAGEERWKEEEGDREAPIWIVAGDFNFTPEALEHAMMVRHGFMDLMPSHEVGTKAKGLGNDPSITVDYVFAGPRFEAMDPGAVRRAIKGNRVIVPDVSRDRVSDHYPLDVSVPILIPPKPRE